MNSLIIGKPLIGTDINAHNEFIYQEINGETKTRAHRLTTPKDSLKDIENDIKNKGFQGLKVYRYFSSTGDPNECSIEDYLPHEQLELANELGIWITLHMAKQDGCGDKRNLSDLEEFTTKRYPNIKWILAHVARSFTYRPIEKVSKHRKRSARPQHSTCSEGPRRLPPRGLSDGFGPSPQSPDVPTPVGLHAPMTLGSVPPPVCLCVVCNHSVGVCGA